MVDTVVVSVVGTVLIMVVVVVVVEVSVLIAVVLRVVDTVLISIVGTVVVLIVVGPWDGISMYTPTAPISTPPTSMATATVAFIFSLPYVSPTDSRLPYTRE